MSVKHCSSLSLLSSCFLTNEKIIFVKKHRDKGPLARQLLEINK